MALPSKWASKAKQPSSQQNTIITTTSPQQSPQQHQSPKMEVDYSSNNKAGKEYYKNTEAYKNKVLNTRRIANELLSKAVSGTIQEIYVLNSDVLMAAPKGYFDKIQEVSLRLVARIQSILSQTDKAGLIAKLKSDPMDTTFRIDAFQAINLEYLKFDASNTDKDYMELDRLDRIFVLAMTFNEICGLGPIEPLYRDVRIKEVMCNGPYDVHIETEGLHRVESCRFASHEHLQDLVNKLYASVNREITRTNPYDNARLHDKSRLFVTHQAIAPDGPNLNLRRHPNFWISPENLLTWDSASPEMLEWLGARINAGCSFILNGGMGTGKTTSLSALLGFIPNNKRIVTIEKNIEVKVPEWKMHAAALECIPKKNNSSVYIDMSDLVQAVTQMRPDVIVAGEITGKEAFDACQALNLGHQGATTLHSNGPEQCITRLTSMVSQGGLMVGKDTLELISSAFDFIVTVERLDDGSRKITSVCEISTEPAEGPNGAYLPVIPIWEYRVDKMSKELGTKITGEWVKVNELSQKRTKDHRLDKIQLLNLHQLLEVAKDPNKHAFKK